MPDSFRAGPSDWWKCRSSRCRDNFSFVIVFISLHPHFYSVPVFSYPTLYFLNFSKIFCGVPDKNVWFLRHCLWLCVVGSNLWWYIIKSWWWGSCGNIRFINIKGWYWTDSVCAGMGRTYCCFCTDVIRGSGMRVIEIPIRHLISITGSEFSPNKVCGL